jgi:hypothetical protein
MVELEPIVMVWAGFAVVVVVVVVVVCGALLEE